MDNLLVRNHIFGLFLLFCISCSLGNWEQAGGPWGGSITDIIGFGDTVFTGSSSGLFVSFNNGEDWELAKNELSGYLVTELDYNKGVLYASAGDFIFKSTDRGRSWEKNLLLPDLRACIRVTALAKFDSSMFIGFDDCNPISFNDNSASWDVLGDSITLGANHFFWKDSLLFIAGSGLYRSNNKGHTLEKISLSQTANDSLYCNSLAMTSTALFVSSDMGIFRSSDNGSTWFNCSPAEFSSIKDKYTIPLVSTGTTLLAGLSPYGILRSTDNGLTWVVSDTGLIGKVKVLSVIGKTIFAGTSGNGIYRSTDDGKTWVSANRGLFLSEIQALAVNKNTLFATTSGGVYRLTENSLDWKLIHNNVSNTFPALTVKDSFVIAAAGSDGVVVSLDNGSTWKQTSNGFTTDLYINTIAIGGEDIYAGGGNGLYVSIDSGSSWKLLENNSSRFLASDGDGIVAHQYNYSFYRISNHGLSSIKISEGFDHVVTVDAFVRIGQTIFAAAWEKIYRSSNNGQSWSIITGEGLSFNGHVKALTSAGNSLFAAMWESTRYNIYVSNDQGDHWTNITQDIHFDKISSMVVYDTMIYAGTGTSGVWRRPLKEVVKVKDSGRFLNNDISGKYTLHKSEHSSIITIKLSQEKMVNAEILDLSGKRVMHLVHAQIRPGIYQYKWDFKKEPPGCYLLRLQIGNAIHTETLLVFR
jgi:hypothetical protein